MTLGLKIDFDEKSKVMLCVKKDSVKIINFEKVVSQSNDTRMSDVTINEEDKKTLTMPFPCVDFFYSGFHRSHIAVLYKDKQTLEFYLAK